MRERRTAQYLDEKSRYNSGSTQQRSVDEESIFTHHIPHRWVREVGSKATDHRVQRIVIELNRLEGNSFRSTIEVHGIVHNILKRSNYMFMDDNR